MSSGYGYDMWCADSIVSGRFVTGWLLVAQALYRRVTTPRGMLRKPVSFDADGAAQTDEGGGEEGAYGLDLADYIGAVGYDSAAAALPGLVRGEWRKDDRVQDVDITAAITTGTDGQSSIVLSALVTLVDEGESFNLTLSVSTDGVAILAAEAA